MAGKAQEIDANTFQFFLRNPRGGAAKALDPADVAAFEKLRRENLPGPLVAHAPYTLNPCAASEKVRQFSFSVFREDLEKLEQLPGVMYNFHPGCHVGQGSEKGVSLVADMLNRLLKPEQKTMVLLETMSGKGSEVGSTFEELAMILKRVNLPEKMGICLDTCHVYAAGYDIVNDLDGVLERFDRVAGLSRLMAVHINDSMMPFASRKDRHACIGAGHIELEALARLVHHPSLRHLPFILETPNDLPGYASEIVVLREACPFGS